MSSKEDIKEEILSQIGLSKENRKKLEELYGNKNPKFFGNKSDPHEMNVYESLSFCCL